MKKLIMHELGENQFCPNCGKVLRIKENVSLTEANLCIWTCKTYGCSELIEVLLVKGGVKEDDSEEITT